MFSYQTSHKQSLAPQPPVCIIFLPKSDEEIDEFLLKKLNVTVSQYAAVRHKLQAVKGVNDAIYRFMLQMVTKKRGFL